MKIVFTVGDINGIGFEVLLKALSANPSWFQKHSFSIVASSIIIQKLLEKYSNVWNKDICKYSENSIIINNNEKQKIEIIEIKNPIAKNFIKDFNSNGINSNKINIEFGQITKEAGIIAYHSILEATKLTINKNFDAIITLPISKKAIHLSEKSFVGHTEKITELCEKKQSIMILFTDKLRVALATTHIPIYSVSRRITKKRLQTLIKNFCTVLKNDFGIEEPKIAVLGLNPHSSDNSMFGNEEEKIIIPAINVMQRKGINVFGTFSSDGFFARKQYENFDGVIAMYHDQGLIPLKMLTSGGGVNFTACLPIVRTSPDHGTAFEIAGKNIANANSMIDAINSAIGIANNRANKKTMINGG